MATSQSIPLFSFQPRDWTRALRLGPACIVEPKGLAWFEKSVSAIVWVSVCVFEVVAVVGSGGCVCVGAILKGKGWGGWGGQSPRYALQAEFEFQTTQEDGGEDMKDNRHISMSHVFLWLKKHVYTYNISITSILLNSE